MSAKADVISDDGVYLKNGVSVRRLHLVRSSQIKKTGYDPDKKYLVVMFDNESIYGYEGVPAVLYTEMLNAESVGSYFSTRVKGVYKYNKLAPNWKEG